MANDSSKNEMRPIELRRINPNGKTLLKLDPTDDAQFGLSEEDDYLSSQEFAKLQLKITAVPRTEASNSFEWEITRAFLILPEVKRNSEEPLPEPSNLNCESEGAEFINLIDNKPPSYNECFGLDVNSLSKIKDDIKSSTTVFCQAAKSDCYRERKYEVLREKMQNPVNLTNPNFIELPRVHNEHPLFALSEILEYPDYDPMEPIDQHQVLIKQIISVRQLAEQHEHYDIDVEMDKFDLENYAAYMENGKLTLGSGPFMSTFVKHSPDEFVTVCKCVNCLQYRKIVMKYVILQLTESKMLDLFLKVFTNFYGGMLKSPAAYNSFQCILNNNKHVYWLTCGLLYNANVNQLQQFDHRNISSNVVMVLFTSILMISNPCLLLQILAFQVEAIVKAYASGYQLSLQEPENINKEEAEVMLNYIINGYEDVVRIAEQVGVLFFAFEKNLLRKLKLPWEMLCKRIYQHNVFEQFEDDLLSCLLTLKEKPITEAKHKLIKRFIVFDEEMKSIEKHWPLVWMEINKFIICAPEYERRSNMSDVYRIFKSLADDAINIPEVRNYIYSHDHTDDGENLKNFYSQKDSNYQWLYTLNFLVNKWNINGFKPPNTTICDDKCINCNEPLWYHVEDCECIACSVAGSPLPPRNYVKSFCEACCMGMKAINMEGKELYESKLLNMCANDDIQVMSARTMANRRLLLMKTLENASVSDVASGETREYHIAWAVFKHLPDRKPFKFKTIDRKYFCKHCERTACLVAKKLLLNTLDPTVTILLMSYYQPLDVNAAELCIVAPNLRMFNRNLVAFNLASSHKETSLKILWVFIISLFAEHFMELREEELDITKMFPYLELSKGDIRVAFRNLTGNKADNKFFEFLQFVNSHPCGEFIDMDDTGFGEQIEFFTYSADNRNYPQVNQQFNEAISDINLVATPPVASGNTILLRNIAAEQRKLQEQYSDKQMLSLPTSSTPQNVAMECQSSPLMQQPTSGQHMESQQTVMTVSSQNNQILPNAGNISFIHPNSTTSPPLPAQTIRRKQRIIEHIKLQQEQHFQQDLHYLHHQQIKQHEMMRKQRLQQAHQLMQEKQQILQKQQMKKQHQLQKSLPTMEQVSQNPLLQPLSELPLLKQENVLAQPNLLSPPLNPNMLQNQAIAGYQIEANSFEQHDVNTDLSYCEQPPIEQDSPESPPPIDNGCLLTYNYPTTALSTSAVAAAAAATSSCTTASSSTTTTLTSKIPSSPSAVVTSSPKLATPSAVVSPNETTLSTAVNTLPNTTENQTQTQALNQTQPQPQTQTQTQPKRNAKTKKCKSCFEHPELSEHCLNGHCNKKRVKKDCSHTRVNETRDRLRKKLSRIANARKNEQQKEGDAGGNGAESNEGTSEPQKETSHIGSATPTTVPCNKSVSKISANVTTPPKKHSTEINDTVGTKQSEQLKQSESDDTKGLEEHAESEKRVEKKGTQMDPKAATDMTNDNDTSNEKGKKKSSVSPSTSSEKSSIEDIDAAPFPSSKVENFQNLNKKRRKEIIVEPSNFTSTAPSKKAAKKAKQKLRKEESKRIAELVTLRTQYQVIYFKEFINKLNLKNHKSSKKRDKKKITELENNIKNLQRSKAKIEMNILELIATVKQTNTEFKFSYLPTKEQQMEKLEELEGKLLNDGTILSNKHDIDKLAHSLLKLNLQHNRDESQSRESNDTPSPEEVDAEGRNSQARHASNADASTNGKTAENHVECDSNQPTEYSYPLHIQPKPVALGFLGKPIFQPMCYGGQPPPPVHGQQIVTEMPSDSSDPSKRIVTIRRVNMPNASEPQVTVTARGTSPDKDKLLYTFVNGQMVPTTSSAAAENMKNGVQYYEFPQLATMAAVPTQMAALSSQLQASAIPMHVPVPSTGLMPMPIPIQMRYPTPHILPGHPILVPTTHQPQVPVSMYQAFEPLSLQPPLLPPSQPPQSEAMSNNKKKAKKGKKKGNQDQSDECEENETTEKRYIPTESTSVGRDSNLALEEEDVPVKLSKRSIKRRAAAARKLELQIAEAAAAAAAAEEKLRQQQEKQMLLQQQKEKQEQKLKQHELQKQKQVQNQNQKKKQNAKQLQQPHQEPQQHSQQEPMQQQKKCQKNVQLPIKVQPQTQIETKTQTQPKTQPQSKTHTHTQSKTQLQSKTQPQSKTQTQPQSKTQTQPQLKTQMQPQSKTQTQLQSKTQPQSQSKPQTQSQFKTETHSQLKTPMQTQTKPQPQPHSQNQNKTQSANQENTSSAKGTKKNSRHPKLQEQKTTSGSITQEVQVTTLKDTDKKAHTQHQKNAKDKSVGNASQQSASSPSLSLATPQNDTEEKQSECSDKLKRQKVVDKGQFDNNPYKSLNMGNSDSEWESSRPTSPESEKEDEIENVIKQAPCPSKVPTKIVKNSKIQQQTHIGNKKSAEPSVKNINEHQISNGKHKETTGPSVASKNLSNQATNAKMKTEQTPQTLQQHPQNTKNAKKSKQNGDYTNGPQVQKPTSGSKTSSRSEQSTQHTQNSQHQYQQPKLRSQSFYKQECNVPPSKSKKQSNTFYSTNSHSHHVHQPRTVYNSSYYKSNDQYDNEHQSKRSQKPNKRNTKQYYSNDSHDQQSYSNNATYYKSKDSEYYNQSNKQYESERLSREMQRMHISQQSKGYSQTAFGHVNEDSTIKAATVAGGYSIMDQLKSGVQVEHLALPPGITLTKVDPVKSEQLRQKSESIKKLSQPLASQQTPQVEAPAAATIIAPHFGNYFANTGPYAAIASTKPNIINQNNGVIMVDANVPNFVRSQSNDSSATVSSSKSAKNKKKKNKAKVQNAESPLAVPTPVQPGASQPKMITLRNPMFHGPDAARILQQNQLQAQRSLATNILSSPAPPVEQQAAIIKNENGIYTIRNPALHQAVTSGLVASGFANLTNVSYYTPQEAAAEAAKANAAKLKEQKITSPQPVESFSYFSSVSPKPVVKLDDPDASNNLNNISITCSSIGPRTLTHQSSHNFNNNGTDLGTDLLAPMKKPISAIGSEIKNAQQQRQKPIVKEVTWPGYGLDLTDTCVYRGGNVAGASDVGRKDFISNLQDQYRKSSYYNGFESFPPSVSPETAAMRTGGGSLFDDIQMHHSCGDDSPPPTITGYNSYLEGIPNTGVIRYDDASFLKTLIPGQRLNNEVSIHNVNDSNFTRSSASPLSHHVEISPIFPNSSPTANIQPTAANYRENAENFPTALLCENGPAL